MCTVLILSKPCAALIELKTIKTDVLTGQDVRLKRFMKLIR